MKLIIIIILGIIGLLYCLYYPSNYVLNGFTNNNCPNLLVKKGSELHLINSNAPKVEGSNPLKFNNLEEYAQFVKKQKANNIRCPILFYEQTYDTQNKKGYRMLKNPFERDAGMPTYKEQVSKRENSNANIRLLNDAHRDDPPYNKNNYAGFDQDDQHIGVKTPLDLVGDVGKVSANPMAPNWGGHEYTHNEILSGKYDGRKRILK